MTITSILPYKRAAPGIQGGSLFEMVFQIKVALDVQ
jgi:hypothetical protein